MKYFEGEIYLPSVNGVFKDKWVRVAYLNRRNSAYEVECYMCSLTGFNSTMLLGTRKESTLGHTESFMMSLK